MLSMNVATPDRRHYSTILAEFPWYSEELALKPKSIMANSDKLPGYEVSITSLVWSLQVDVEFNSKFSVLRMRFL